jgi:hypothetical protein
MSKPELSSIDTKNNVTLMRKEKGIVWPYKTFAKLCNILMFNASPVGQGTFKYVIKADAPGAVSRIIIYPDGRVQSQSTEQNHPLNAFVKDNLNTLLRLAPRLRSPLTLVGKVSVSTNPPVFIVYYTIQDDVADVSTNALMNLECPCFIAADSTDVLSMNVSRQQVICPSIPSTFQCHVDLIGFPTDIDTKEEANVNPAMIEAVGFRLFKGTHAWTYQ